jgi:serine/threonine-protein kinase
MLDPGTQIDFFVILQAIGAGGMGAVYRAEDRRLERQVALKILPTEFASDSESVQRFYQEARAAARLDHENIARIYTIGHEDPYHFIAFEFIEGINLREMVALRGPRSVAEAINDSLQIAGALVHAAQRGVVHRDIKPSNIIITPQGRAKLVDMGLARRHERDELADAGLTQSGMTLGTFDYISPEQARDPRNVDTRSDLYSLGCTMYFLLTGQPPFPEGNPVKKLLQHQELPAPDVRLLAPHVPADLAAIILKLMAKDREHRYQTPELLVRDLLAVAASQGLRPVSPDGLVWMAAKSPASWERHLVWAFPVAVLGLVVGLLTWVGEQESGLGPPGPRSPLSGPSAVANKNPTNRKSAGSPVLAVPDVTKPKPLSAAVDPGSGPAQATVGLPPAREVRIADGEELARLLAQPLTSSLTVVLDDDRPYLIPPLEIDLGGRGPGPAASLTLRAAPGSSPVIRLASVAGAIPKAAAAQALLRFRGGRATLEGIELDLDPAESSTINALVRASDTELRLIRCVFRHAARAGGAFVSLLADADPQAAASSDHRIAPVLVEESQFEGGSPAIDALDGTDVQARDCTFAPSASAFEVAAGARLSLRHVSVAAGTGPVFQVTGAPVLLRVENSVIAPALGRSTLLTLVATTQAESVDWIGRDNLFARVGTFLRLPASGESTPPIRQFEAWADAPGTIAEVGSRAIDSTPWSAPDASSGEPLASRSQSFHVEPSQARPPGVGSRRGPKGPIEPYPSVLAGTAKVLDAAPRDATAPISSSTPPILSQGSVPDTSSVFEPMTLEPLLQNPPDPSAAPLSPPAAAPVAVSSIDTSPLATPPDPDGASRVTAPSVPGAAKASVSEVRTAKDLLDALRDPSTSSPIRLAPGSRFDLTDLDLNGPINRIVAGPSQTGAIRPRLRFRLYSEGTNPTTVPVRVHAGRLTLRDVDLVLITPGTGGLPANPAAPGLFAIDPGAWLELDRCTVTLAGPRDRPSLVIVPGVESTAVGLPDPTDPPPGSAPGNPPIARIQLTDCLVRTATDLLAVGAGRSASLTANDCILATSAALVHAQGTQEGSLARDIELSLDRCMVRTGNGLVDLESSPDQPVLPVARLRVSESNLSTNRPGDPLVRVDGQADLESLRDRIHWEGRRVAYHQVTTYRRDQSSQPGSVPLRFDQSDWDLSVSPHDEQAYHGRLPFVRPWDATRDAWTLTREDARLTPDGSAPPTGPDLARIPDPPTP